MSEASASPKRPRLDFDDSSKDDINDKYSKNRDQDDQQSSYSNSRKRRADPGDDDDDMKDCDDIKSKNIGGDAARREHTLVMRLTNKEQELQECMNQIQEMKQQQTQNTTQLRSMLLDPAINLVFQRMSKEMEEHKEKLKQKQNELNAWKFTPDSQTGMRLMGKCRMLLQENGELGKVISSGRTARLEGEISLHKALVTEMKKNQKELDEFVGELEEDVEGMQGMIFMLQQQLKEAREQISRLQQENEQLRTLQLPSESEPGGSGDGGVFKNGIGAAMSLSSSTSSSSQHIHSITDPAQTKSSSSSTNLRVPNSLIPLSNSSDSALTSAGSTADEFSPGSISLKVTPDSGIQTQEEEEEDATDSMSVDEFSRSDSAAECNNFESKNSRTANNGLEKDVRTRSDVFEEKNNYEDDEGLRTLRCGNDIDGKETANHSVNKFDTHERTTSPSSDLVTKTNGDIQVKEEDGNEVKRTLLDCGDRDANDYSKERTEGENKIECKLTSNNSSSNDKIEDLTECLGLKDDYSTVNSLIN